MNFIFLGGPSSPKNWGGRRYGRDLVPNSLGTAFGLAPIATAGVCGQVFPVMPPQFHST
jgi:hypothetical protein